MRNRVFHNCAFSITIALVATLWFNSYTLAKEDTAHLIFKKSAPAATETFTYTVKKGDHLLAIIKNELGITKNRYALIKRYNPRLKNLNVIRPGQKLVLPVPPNRAAGPQNVGSGVEGSSEPEAKKGLLQATEEGLPSPNRLIVMQSILKRMDGNMMISGRYVVPLPEIGQVSVDCERIPVVEFDDGSVVFMDFKKQMPEDIKKLVRKHWANYIVVAATDKDDPLSTLADAVNASQSYSMKELVKPLFIGQNPSIRLLADWMISGKPASGKGGYRHALVVINSEERRLPRPVLSYLDKNRLTVTEILNNTVLPPRADMPASTAASALPRLNTGSVRDLVSDLLILLGLKPVLDTDVQIFESPKDGFNLSVKADLETRSGNQRLIFTSKTLPRQFIDILQSRATEIVSLTEKDPPKTAIEKTLIALKLRYTMVPYLFPVSALAKTVSAKVLFPTICIPLDPPLYLIDFVMDAELYGLLHDNLGFKIVQY